jgi:hypothetical protein
MHFRGFDRIFLLRFKLVLICESVLFLRVDGVLGNAFIEIFSELLTGPGQLSTRPAVGDRGTGTEAFWRLAGYIQRRRKLVPKRACVVRPLRVSRLTVQSST